MGMRLDHGGHLSHGSPVNFSSKLYRFVAYGLDPDSETLDYDVIAKLARENQPKVIVAGYTAYSRTVDFERFGQIADEVGATLMVDMAHIAGLIAAGAHPSCLPHAQLVIRPVIVFQMHGGGGGIPRRVAALAVIRIDDEIATLKASIANDAESSSVY